MWCLKFQGAIKPNVFQSSFVKWFSLFELILIARKTRITLVGHQCQLFSNMIEISYRSMLNVKNLIKQHNLKILSKKHDKIQQLCNCTVKESCPLNSKCLQQFMICNAEVTTNTTYKEYYRMLEGEPKSLYNNHTQFFRYILSCK